MRLVALAKFSVPTNHFSLFRVPWRLILFYLFLSETGRNFGINLKEVIDRFIWTIALSYLKKKLNTFLTVLYSQRQPM
jgi:hypothetical protein